MAIKRSAQQFTDRFEREARAVAALNHPHICQLYDVGPDYLVMEYIEGAPLKGSLPVDQALKYAEQICDALDAAHRRGITHRDLKPGNILLSKQGIKLLDFGLAQMQPGPDDSTMMQVTQAGAVVGTPAYMAPEQWEGKKADARSDIYAFGCVLYEMLTGKRAVVNQATGDRAPIAPPLEEILRTCLEKDPDERWQSARELKHALRWAAEAKPASFASSRSRLGMAGWIMAGVATLFAAALAFVPFRDKPPLTHVVTRFQYLLPEGQSFTRTSRHALAISPDGTKLAYVANQQLYLRAMDQLEAQPVRGTNEDPMEPVFSPDGQWLAYFVPAGGAGSSGAGGALRKIAIAGGAPVTLCQLAAAPYGVTWREQYRGVFEWVGPSSLSNASASGPPALLMARYARR